MRKMESGGKAPKDESAAAADDKYRYLPNYYKVKRSDHFADSSSSMVECKLPAPCSYLGTYLLFRKEKKSKDDENKKTNHSCRRKCRLDLVVNDK